MYWWVKSFQKMPGNGGGARGMVKRQWIRLKENGPGGGGKTGEGEQSIMGACGQGGGGISGSQVKGSNIERVKRS